MSPHVPGSEVATGSIIRNSNERVFELPAWATESNRSRETSNGVPVGC